MNLNGLRRVGLGETCKVWWSGGRRWGGVEGDGGRRRIVERALGERKKGSGRGWENGGVSGRKRDGSRMRCQREDGRICL
jgi:hypothetical protein